MTSGSPSVKTDSNSNVKSRSSRIVIIGGGIIGSALAMGFARAGAPAGSVTVVDPDLDGGFSSSERNAGGVRATFHQAINIRASKVSIDYFANVADEIGFRECGYLWLCDAEQAVLRESRLGSWRGEGWPVERLSPSEITRRYPLLDRMDGVSAGYLGPRDGILNTNLLKTHYRSVARAAGVRFVDRRFFRGGERVGDEWRLRLEVLPSAIDDEGLEGRLTAVSSVSYEGGSSSQAVEFETVAADVVVNCAGAWAGEIARALGTTTHATPVRRQISLFDHRGGNTSGYGMIIDTSGVYFHPEATSFLAGVAEKEEPAGKNFAYGGDDFFQEKIWMPLSERSSAFETLKHVSGWAGLYEVSPDESGIVGEAGLPGLFEAHSFSGHGVMHSYAVGMALAEKIRTGEYATFDFSTLAGDRFETGRTLPETAVI